MNKFKYFKRNIPTIFIIFVILSKDIIFHNFNINSYKSRTIKNNDFQSDISYINTIENTTIINDSLYYIEYEITQTFFLNYTISINIILLNALSLINNHNLNKAIKKSISKINETLRESNNKLYNDNMYIFFIKSEKFKNIIQKELNNILAGKNIIFILSHKINNNKYDKFIKKIIYNLDMLYNYKYQMFIEKYKYMDIIFLLMIIFVCFLFKYIIYHERKKRRKKRIYNVNCNKSQLLKNILNNYCIICLDFFVSKNNKNIYDKDIIFLDCEHAFHEKCIKKWFQNHNKCPICRILFILNKKNVNIF